MVPNKVFTAKQYPPRRISFLLALLCCLVVQRGSAQNDARIIGVVSDSVTHQTISQVNVTVRGVKTGTFTDSLGRFHLSLVPGEHWLSFGHIGYAPTSILVTTSSGETSSLTVLLVPSPVPIRTVTVYADSQSISTIRTLGAKVLFPAKVPYIGGVFGDIGRSLQAMAGVSTNNESSAQFSVRGGTMFQNLLLLNGAEIIEPFHLKESPNTGITIINTDLLNRALFVPGGFTARYGDCLSAVLDLELREGNRDRFAALLDANLADGMITVESPLGSKSSVLVSARSSYGDYVARYLTEQNQRRPTFYDLAENLALQLSEHHRLSVDALYASDQTRGLADGRYNTSLLGFRETSTLSSSTTLYTTLSFSRQFEDLSRSAASLQDSAISWSRDSSRIELAEAKVHVDAQLSESFSVAGGVRLQLCRYDARRQEFFYADSMELPRSGAIATSGVKAGAYLENILLLTPELSANAGFRWDVFSITGENAFSPRLHLSYQVQERTTLSASWGLFYQTPSYHEMLAASQAGEPPQRMQLAKHYIIGIERALERGMQFRAEAYFKQLYRLIGYERLRSGDFVYSATNDSRGETYGLDLEISFRDERVSGWMNASVMKAKEVLNAPGALWHYSPMDQRMAINFVFEPRIADGWILSLRSYYGTGFAYVNDLPHTRLYTRDHYPDYKRLDIRLNYSFKTGPFRSTAFVEITNVFSMRNVRSFQGTLYDDATPDYNLLLPMVINAGLRYEY